MFGSFGGGNEIYTGDIPASLRFRAAASAYLSRAFSSAASTGTISTFVKRGALGTAQSIAGSRYSAGTNSRLEFTASDTIALILAGTTVCTTTAVYRDPTSWLHVVATFAPNGTAYIYVNGTQVASGATGASPWFFTNAANYVNAIGRLGDLAGNYFDGYQARFAFVDGSALTPSSFGYLNTEINEWVSKSQSAVKAVVDAGGTNSFMLDFDNGTSLTTLGYDKSSKGNNWTLNGHSLTLGSTYDWMLDVPGNNYATLNPLDKYSSTVLTNGNLNITVSGARASLGVSSGTYYFEVYVVNIGSASSAHIALADAFAATNFSSGSFYYYRDDGVRSGGAAVAPYTTGDIIGVAFSPSAGTAAFYKNNILQFSLTGVGFSTPWFPMVMPRVTAGDIAINFGQRPFTYTPPTGYKALCQRNLPDPAILNPEKHFDIRTRTGDAASPKVLMSDLLFSPDFIWTKDRNTGYQHTLQDRVRGTGPSGKLYSSLTEAEGGANSVYGYISSFDSAGVTATVGSSGFGHINANAVTYVDWLWKAGGAAVTNNAGSISSQVSANVEAGFSIVTYTGNLSSAVTATVGHGLGQAPGLIISKSRNNAGGDNGQWVARHKYLASVNHYLRLNTTDTPVDSSANGSMSASTSTVFSTNWTSGMNINGGNYVAYCFAEIPGFSKIFSYTGNGSADGPFVHCGFKPKFILYKRSDNAANWVIWDAIRSPENVVNDYLLPNSSGAEATLDTLDIVSNGFKLRTTNADNNGGTIVGIAFADVPGKYALAR